MIDGPTIAATFINDLVNQRRAIRLVIMVSVYQLLVIVFRDLSVFFWGEYFLAHNAAAAVTTPCRTKELTVEVFLSDLI